MSFTMKGVRVVPPDDETPKQRKAREKDMLKEVDPETGGKIYVRCFECNSLVTEAINDTCFDCLREEEEFNDEADRIAAEVDSEKDSEADD